MVLCSECPRPPLPLPPFPPPVHPLTYIQPPAHSVLRNPVMECCEFFVVNAGTRQQGGEYPCGFVGGFAHQLFLGSWDGGNGPDLP